MKIKQLVVSTLLMLSFSFSVSASVILSPIHDPVAVDNPTFGSADLFGTGGWAVTSGGNFIDAPLYYFDLGGVVPNVSSAILSMDAIQLIGNTEIQISVFADDGVPQLTDYRFFPPAIDVFTYINTGVRSIDVTSAVNALLPGQFLVFQFQSSIFPTAHTSGYEGVRFGSVLLEIDQNRVAVTGPNSLGLVALSLLGLGFYRRKVA